jgi:hypothetical protein
MLSLPRSDKAEDELEDVVEDEDEAEDSLSRARCCRPFKAGAFLHFRTLWSIALQLEQ